MAKQNKARRLQSGPTKKARGRTAKTIEHNPEVTRQGAMQLVNRTEVSRSMGKSSGGKNRGNRRDMSSTYSGTAKHAARGNTPRRGAEGQRRYQT